MRREDRDKALRPAREDWREKKPKDEDAPSGPAARTQGPAARTKDGEADADHR